MKKKVSFDFDETLANDNVQDYAKELVTRGYEVWIVTTRWKDPNKYHFHVTHDDIHKAMVYIGIPEENVHFNDMEYKHTYFINHPDFLFHLDDNPVEKQAMEACTKVPCILYGWKWKEKCEKILNLKETENGNKRKN